MAAQGDGNSLPAPAHPNSSRVQSRFQITLRMPRPVSIAIGLMIAVVMGTFLWLIVRSIRRSEDAAKLLFKYVLSVVFIGLFIGFILKIGFDSEAAVIIPFG